MQALWGEVLAREVASPGTFGFRTLDTLRQQSRHEAEIFRRVCAIAMTDDWIAILGNDIKTALIPFWRNVQRHLDPPRWGLTFARRSVTEKFHSSNSYRKSLLLKPVTESNGVTIQLSGAVLVDLQLPALIFTKSGREIQRLIEPQEHQEYLKAFSSYVGSMASLRSVGYSPERPKAHQSLRLITTSDRSGCSSTIVWLKGLV